MWHSRLHLSGLRQILVLRRERGMKQLKADFCVVGAGYAGLAAAYQLQKKHSVIVLEAGGHPGGRVWTEHLSDGTPFDIGGAWVGDEQAQPNIRALMKE